VVAEKWNRDEVCDAIEDIPFHQQHTIRALAAALGNPSITLEEEND
jgi:hypothetical protein